MTGSYVNGHHGRWRLITSLVILTESRINFSHLLFDWVLNLANILVGVKGQERCFYTWFQASVPLGVYTVIFICRLLKSNKHLGHCKKRKAMEWTIMMILKTRKRGMVRQFSFAPQHSVFLNMFQVLLKIEKNAVWPSVGQNKSSRVVKVDVFLWKTVLSSSPGSNQSPVLKKGEKKKRAQLHKLSPLGWLYILAINHIWRDNLTV